MMLVGKFLSRSKCNHFTVHLSPWPMSGGTKRKQEPLIVRDGEQLSDDDEEIVVSPLMKKFRRTISRSQSIFLNHIILAYRGVRIESLPDELLLIIFQRFQADELILV